MDGENHISNYGGIHMASCPWFLQKDLDRQELSWVWLNIVLVTGAHVTIYWTYMQKANDNQAQSFKTQYFMYIYSE